MDLCFIYNKKYQVPDVIRAIGLDPGPHVIRASTGLNVSELKGEDLIGQEDRQIMMQWAMEAFTNPEVIDNSMRYVERNDLFQDKFLQSFQLIDIGPLRRYDLLAAVSLLLRPQSNGTVIQRGNTYTYRMPDFMIATSQAYHPGTCGDQHQIWTATLSEEVSLFTTHPGKPLMLGDTPGNSPGYWVGNGRLPHCVQHKHIVLCMYELDDEPGFLEQDVADFTHAYFPMDKLADVEIDGRFAFARHRNTLVAFVTRYPLEYAAGSGRPPLLKAGRAARHVGIGYSASIDRSDKSCLHHARELQPGTPKGTLPRLAPVVPRSPLGLSLPIRSGHRCLRRDTARATFTVVLRERLDERSIIRVLRCSMRVRRAHARLSDQRERTRWTHVPYLVGGPAAEEVIDAAIPCSFSRIADRGAWAIG